MLKTLQHWQVFMAARAHCVMPYILDPVRKDWSCNIGKGINCDTYVSSIYCVACSSSIMQHIHFLYLFHLDYCLKREKAPSELTKEFKEMLFGNADSGFRAE